MSIVSSRSPRTTRQAGTEGAQRFHGAYACPFPCIRPSCFIWRTQWGNGGTVPHPPSMIVAPRTILGRHYRRMTSTPDDARCGWALRHDALQALECREDGFRGIAEGRGGWFSLLAWMGPHIQRGRTENGKRGYRCGWGSR